MSKIRFSVSQSKTYGSCNTKWYIEKVLKVPTIFADSTTRGSLLHEVKERYLEANEQDIDPKTGKVVNLYPEGWMTKTEYVRGDDGEDTDEVKQTKTITQKEADWIKRSHDQAVASNVLWRPPNRVVEHKFEELIIPADGDMPEIWAIGYIDLAYDETIGDHKSCRNLKYVLSDNPKSSKYIGDDEQLLLYCYFWAKHRYTLGHPYPKTMDVEHYQYPYEDNMRNEGKGIPQTTKATVTWKRILENLEKFKDKAILSRATRFVHKDYKTVEKNEEACGAYGGCPFRHLCSGQESLQMLTDRTNHAINPEKYNKDKIKKETKVMSAFDDILGDVAVIDKNNTAGASDAAEQTTEAANVPEDKKSPEADSGTKNEPAKSKADPKSKTKPKAKPLEDLTIAELNQKIDVLEDNQDSMGIDLSDAIQKVQAVIDTKQAAADKARADLEAETKKKEADAKAKKAAEKKAASVKAAEDAKASEQAESVDTAETVEDADDAQEDSDASVDTEGTSESHKPDVKSTSERAPSGVFLCVNAVPLKNYAKQVSLSKILNEYGKKHEGASDVLAAICDDVDDIVTVLKGHVILAVSNTPQARQLVAALIEHPKVVAFGGLS